MSAHFKPGDVVTVDDRPALGHCRTPWYVRGRSGVVAEVQGLFRDPERLAYHRPGLPAQVFYKVRFRQTDLWPTYKGAASDRLDVDIADNWLKPAGAEVRR
ncbi:MAG: SH3-like domain-containing protein [Hyphomicrobiaceae bacterium]